MSDASGQYLTIGESARLLQVTRATIARRIRVFNIPTYQGEDLREVLIRKSDLDRFRGVRPMPAAPLEAVRR